MRAAVTFVLFFDERVHVGRRDFPKELDVLVGVELSHLALRRGFGALVQEIHELRIQCTSSGHSLTKISIRL